MSCKTQLASLSSKAIYADMRNVSIKDKMAVIPVISKTKGEVFEDCLETDVVPYENEVSITAFNSSNTVQSYL